MLTALADSDPKEEAKSNVSMEMRNIWRGMRSNKLPFCALLLREFSMALCKDMRRLIDRYGYHYLVHTLAFSCRGLPVTWLVWFPRMLNPAPGMKGLRIRRSENHGPERANSIPNWTYRHVVWQGNGGP